LPAGSSSAPGDLAEPTVSQRAAEVASPTGTKPPPAADLPSVAPPPRPLQAQTPTAEQDSQARRAVVHEVDDEAAADDDTAPLPVISFDDQDNDPPAPGPESKDEQAPADRVRDPFEPLDRQSIPGIAELAEDQRRSAARTGARQETTEPASASGPRKSGNGQDRPSAPASKAGPPAPPPEPGSAKMEQIKDLYLTAEAIGEDALDQHFQQVSEKQRELIREYFDQVVRRKSDSQASG
jgi:hypothetical protein